MEKIGKYIRYKREEMNLSQNDLGKRIGVGGGTISRYEKDEVTPPLEKATKLADVFKISVDELCGRTKSDTVSLLNLTNAQAEVIKELVKILHDKNRPIKKRITEEEFAMIGKIVAELTK